MVHVWPERFVIIVISGQKRLCISYISMQIDSCWFSQLSLAHHYKRGSSYMIELQLTSITSQIAQPVSLYQYASEAGQPMGSGLSCSLDCFMHMSGEKGLAIRLRSKAH